MLADPGTQMATLLRSAQHILSHGLLLLLVAGAKSAAPSPPADPRGTGCILSLLFFFILLGDFSLHAGLSAT